MTYQLVLQTIGTLTSVVGVSIGLYVGIVARRVHGAIGEQTTDLKQSIKEQTDELKP